MRRFSSKVPPPKVREHKAVVRTRFPTKFNPVRSAFKQVIVTPPGVVYNPAPSAPTPLETPAAFLPKAELEARAWVKDAQDYQVDTMPQLQDGPKRTYHLTPQDAAEIQQLRLSEPYKWTRKALAKKYNVSEFVIGLVSHPAPEHTRDMQERLKMIKEQWNDKRARARDHRQRRRNAWIADA